ncbi:hypothetical protein Tco_1058178 [Tanacetum coccineum]|uniref:Uncharacterized protein n=1 Tax=Tanacetum coccineum TaxID=301880 RepID=A0ABQ5H7K9_9ASTR
MVISSENSFSQGLPRHIFNILNQTSTAKEIWDNVELLMQGSGRTLQQRKEDLFDEYERFRAIGNESIHDYFHMSLMPKKTLKKQEQSESIVDPLAYVADTTSAPALPSPSTSSSQPTAQSSNDALMATMTQIANLLSGFQKQFPPTNNQLRISSNSKTHATVPLMISLLLKRSESSRQCKEPKRAKDSQYFKDKDMIMEAKEKGKLSFNHEDAYDSDVDESPNAAAAFMANLSSTSATNSQVNEGDGNRKNIQTSMKIVPEKQAYWLPANENC